MPIYAASRDRSLEEVRTTLEELVKDFEADAAANRKLIRDLMDDGRELFYTAAIDVLKAAGDSRGAQYLIALIVANGMLVDALCEPALDREQAMVIARAAVRVDPMADAMLARRLADSAVGTGKAIADARRLMEILAEIADAARVLPHLMRLLRHPNPYLRSKVVKMIGRGSRSVKWVKGKLNESDPRVRANAVEALWGVDSPEARSLLHFASNDANNRVLGNALLGLYYLGDCSVLEEVVKMSAHESKLFRATAAWVMGETGDVRFSDAVRRMLLEPDPVIRKQALAALGRIRQSNALVAESTKWHVSARLVSGSLVKGLRRVLASVASDNMREQPKIAPIHLILSEGSQYVTSYKVNERPEPEAMSVVFVIPRTGDPDFRPFVDGAIDCLRWKRPSDLWCVLPYLESGDNGLSGQAQEMDAPQFTANPQTVEALLREPAKRMECTDFWTALWRATRTEVGASRGKRHVIVFSRSKENRIAGHGLIANVQAGRVGLQVISTVENPEVAEFCRRTYTRFCLGTEEDIPELVRQAYLAILARYEITYQPVCANPPVLKLRVQTPEGWGETIIPFQVEGDR